MRLVSLILALLILPIEAKSETVNMEVKLELISKAEEVPMQDTQQFCLDSAIDIICQDVPVVSSKDNTLHYEIEDGFAVYQDNLD